MDLDPGIYDRLVDDALRQAIERLDAAGLTAQIESVDPSVLPELVADVVSSWTRQGLELVGEKDRAVATARLTDSMLRMIESLKGVVPAPLESPLTRLVAVEKLSPLGDPIQLGRPMTSLRDTVLMTNARGQPGVGREIKAEIHSADRIDLVLAFIRWTGIRDLMPSLERHVMGGGRLRVVTTTYTGSTELRALQALVDLGAEVKVSYDTGTTRLHAKAWHFHRRSGFSTVYIGSSNLTFSAHVTGLEWNVRAAEPRNPELISTFSRTFETYWADDHFEDFNADRFAAATTHQPLPSITSTPFDISPYPFQARMLEQLEADRLRGHPNNLVVAATGTGKTIVAALDYRRLREQLDRARLLFVAHRSEILEQSRDTFRHVLRDGSFGELWVGGEKPSRWEHVFASIQSLSVNDVTTVDPQQFDVVIVDEFHHAAARSYEKLLAHLQPLHLLGLTATPERADGLDILQWFDNRTSVELRLWDALEQGLLAPFHYFGLHDATDLSTLTWRSGAYDVSELTSLYTAHDLRTSRIIREVNQKIGDPQAMRALGFCVSIAHAEYMAAAFLKSGINAKAITSDSPSQERASALASLAAGDLQALFTVDLFNEGVDIPAIDVVLMLRPTESATVFLQQLGRGLRRTEGKDVLTVLDFVGDQRREFRFDLRYRRMLGRTRRELERDIEEDFPFLPAGCQVHLESAASSIILRNIREALPTTWKRRVQELRELGDVSLSTFLAESGLDLEDIYRGGRSWTALRRAALLPTLEKLEGEEAVGRGVGRLLHLDDLDRIETYRTFLSQSSPPYASTLNTRDGRRLHGLLLSLFGSKKKGLGSTEEVLERLWRHSEIRHELLDVLSILEESISRLHQPLDIRHPIPLQVHASYSREEILAAFGASTVSSPLPLQTGVYWHEESETDLFLVTINKSVKDYTPTTLYNDYAISNDLFHWESQSTTAIASETGQRYISHVSRGSKVALFVREAKEDFNGRTMPYFCAGHVTYVEHTGERPIAMTWRLKHSLPGDIYAAYRAAIA
jgi:superfamily II DNA or RNA helicase|tara:strand:- start:748 stop:3828 length:3081 start_codon:yes stop_codon:yes gene_type:complete